MSLRTRKSLALLLVAVTALMLFGEHLSAPLGWNHEGWNGSYYGVAARNFLRYGYTDLGFMHCVEAGSIVDHPTMYLRHPAMNSLLASLSLRLFGDHEFSLRLVPYLLSVASSLLVFLWMDRYLRIRPLMAATAAILAAATPAWALFGSMLEPLGSGVIFSIVGSLYFADRWLESRSGMDQILVLSFLLFGFLYDWAAFYTAGFLGLFLWASSGRRGWRLAALYWGFAVTCGSLLILWLFELGRTMGFGAAKLSQLANHRMGWFGAMQDDNGHPLSFGQVLTRILGFHSEHFYVVLSIAGLASAILLALRSRARFDQARTLLLLIPLGTGLLHILIFPQGAYVHAYWQVYLAVGLSIPLSVFIARFTDRHWQTRADVWILGLALALAVNTAIRTKTAWEYQDASLETCRTQGRELARWTSPDEVILSSGVMAFPPMVQFYADRKENTTCSNPVELARMILIPSQLHGPIGGFLARKEDLAPFLPTLDLLTRDRGWRGPIAIGSMYFWDARP